MKKIIFFFFLGFILHQSAGAQETAKSVYFELGGPGLASFNFDTRFSKKENGIGGRIGFGGFYVDGEGAVFLPIGINYLIGKETKHYFELGAGVTPVFVTDAVDAENFTETFGHILFGYRLQPPKSGFTFRAFISPVFGDGYFIPYFGGVSFGYKFGNNNKKE